MPLAIAGEVELALVSTRRVFYGSEGRTVVFDNMLHLQRTKKN